MTTKDRLIEIRTQRSNALTEEQLGAISDSIQIWESLEVLENDIKVFNKGYSLSTKQKGSRGCKIELVTTSTSYTPSLPAIPICKLFGKSNLKIESVH